MTDSPIGTRSELRHLTIRNATPEDAVTIAGLLPDLGYPATGDQARLRILRIGQFPENDLILAESGGEVLGLCHVQGVPQIASDGYAEINALVVRADSQRRGIGRMLVDWSVSWARNHGYSRLRLRSGIHREGAHRFYEALGFEKSRASFAFDIGVSPEAFEDSPPPGASLHLPVSRPGLISERVALARQGTNDKVLCRMKSGWAVIGDVQFLQGYCLLLPDPVVSSLNDLERPQREAFLLDMARIGDAVLRVTGACRINYEILGNTEPELHAHVFPRFSNEPEERRQRPVWFYDWKNAPRFSAGEHGDLQARLRAEVLRLDIR